MDEGEGKFSEQTCTDIAELFDMGNDRSKIIQLKYELEQSMTVELRSEISMKASAMYSLHKERVWSETVEHNSICCNMMRSARHKSCGC